MGFAPAPLVEPSGVIRLQRVVLEEYPYLHRQIHYMVPLQVHTNDKGRPVVDDTPISLVAWFLFISAASDVSDVNTRRTIHFSVLWLVMNRWRKDLFGDQMGMGRSEQ